jgi:hypothetical protein
MGERERYLDADQASAVFFETATVDERDKMMGFMIAAINYDQFGHPDWIVGNSSGADASGFRLHSDTVIYGRCDPLGAAEVTLGGLHGNVPEQKLNLLQFAAGGAAEPSATSTFMPHSA